MANRLKFRHDLKFQNLYNFCINETATNLQLINQHN